MRHHMTMQTITSQAVTMKQAIRRPLTALVAALSLLVASTAAHAASGPVQLDAAPSQKISDKAAMQNGAKIFLEYCLGCHGISAMRYSRLADIGMTEEQIKGVLPPGAKTGDYIRSSMNRADAKQWFGAAPPDLSVTARSRSSHSGAGTDWIYTFLRTYYEDPSRPTGWNNKTYVGVGMPHVLWEMQKTKSPAEYDSAVGDLTAFLNYASEPSQFVRRSAGIVVMIFLAIFFVIAWRLNKAYWKNVR